ncbi:MAG: HEAT repeat domain-containing protein [Candidatus Obscuribacterales bacterium]|nr:HEAT repeat domain-containing protein [Candidatus Obscuribacterales bacterium]
MRQLSLLMGIAFVLQWVGALTAFAEAPDCCRSNVQELAAKLSGDDYAQRWEALSKLGLYGAEAGSAVPALVKHLSNSEDVHRTVHTLGLIGPPARTAVPDLVLMLNGSLNNSDRFSSDATLSIGLIDALASIREQRELIVPVLRKALDHSNSSIRYEAAHALGLMGGLARPALADLRKLCADKERPPRYVLPYGESVGAAAQEAITRITSK